MTVISTEGACSPNPLGLPTHPGKLDLRRVTRMTKCLSQETEVCATTQQFPLKSHQLEEGSSGHGIKSMLQE